MAEQYFLKDSKNSHSLINTCLWKQNTKLNSVALVRERTIPTERPPPVGAANLVF
jgi:hypothetical protein